MYAWNLKKKLFVQKIILLGHQTVGNQSLKSIIGTSIVLISRVPNENTLDATLNWQA